MMDAQPRQTERPQLHEQPRRRALFSSLGLLMPFFGTRGASAEDTVKVYFGQGCFWHVQHELTLRSLKINREAQGAFPEGSFSPAIAGYAGGLGKNPNGQVCYNAYEGKSYDDLGHAEVVGLELPTAALEQMSKLYFEEASKGPTLPGGFMYSGSPEAVAGRHDPQDTGSAYRSVIGLPGGLASPAGKIVEQANAGRVQLLPGKGGDPDTLGKGVVYVYDSSEFPFYPAELYHQYHDDMAERYSKGYHGLKDTLQKAGVISKQAGCET